jgi:hypothetical protein
MIKMKTTYKGDTLRKYMWEGWQTVEDLSKKFDRTKRMIQKVIEDFRSLQVVEEGVLVIPYTSNKVNSIPIYKLYNKLVI